MHLCVRVCMVAHARCVSVLLDRSEGVLKYIRTYMNICLIVYVLLHL